MLYQWNPRVLEGLAPLGVQPRPVTPPAPIKDFVSGLYRYELRRLRGRLLRREMEKREYAGLVAELRPRYWMLSLPAAEWARPQR